MKSGCFHYEPISPLSFITEIIKINHLESFILPGWQAGGRTVKSFFKKKKSLHIRNIYVYLRQQLAVNVKFLFFFWLSVWGV